MALIKCKECEQVYSSEAQNCIHCGAPNPSFEKKKSFEDHLLEWIGAVVVGLAVFYLSIFGFVMPWNLASGDTLLPTDFTCSSTRLNNLLKSTFDESQYALSNNLKAVLIESVEHEKASDDSRITCESKLTLNNSQTINYIFNVRNKKSGDSDLLVEGAPADDDSTPSN